MSWKNYILTPDEIYPNNPVFSANYTLNQTDYVASIHYDPSPSYTYNQFFTNIPNTNQFLGVNNLSSAPVFDSGLFGYSFYQSTHQYKNGTGNVNSEDILWNSSYKLIITRRYIHGVGFQSEYKTFYNKNKTGGSLLFAYSNSVYSNFLNNSYSPDFDHFRWQSNQIGSLNVTVSVSRPSWLNTETIAPPPTPPTGATIYDLYFHETSDHGFEMDEQDVTANYASLNGWAINNAKAYLFG
jgi:hypothetical protein